MWGFFLFGGIILTINAQVANCGHKDLFPFFQKFESNVNGCKQDMHSLVFLMLWSLLSPNSHIYATYYIMGLDSCIVYEISVCNTFLFPLTKSWKGRDKIFGLCEWFSYLYINNTAVSEDYSNLFSAVFLIADIAIVQ